MLHAARLDYCMQSWRVSDLRSLLGALCLFGCAGTIASGEVAIEFRFLGQLRSQSYVQATRIPSWALSALNGWAATSPNWAQTFPVKVVSGGDDSDHPSMLGSYQMIDGNLKFTPRFPWRPGIRYRATFVSSKLSHLSPDTLPSEGFAERDVALEFTLPKQAQGLPATVSEIYPSRVVLPENQLKFYVHFSAPMSRRNSYRHIHLLDESGNPIEDPFLELGEELWDPSGRRFTLLIDPGRIKRGLKPREDIGPVLEQGKGYVLVVDSKWLDATGNPLDRSHRKSFRVTSADFTQPDSSRWQIKSPPVASREPLVVEFTESLDHAMLQHAIWIKRGTQTVSGSVQVGDQESVWNFRPDEPWSEGRHQLIADTTLEDLAGNSLGRPFEFDIGQNDGPAKPPKTVERRFEVVTRSNQILRRSQSGDADFPIPIRRNLK